MKMGFIIAEALNLATVIGDLVDVYALQPTKGILVKNVNHPTFVITIPASAYLKSFVPIHAAGLGNVTTLLDCVSVKIIVLETIVLNSYAPRCTHFATNALILPVPAVLRDITWHQMAKGVNLAQGTIPAVMFAMHHNAWHARM
jgi:hypothetical protein